jgi:hypothetical protein
MQGEKNYYDNNRKKHSQPTANYDDEIVEKFKREM